MDTGYKDQIDELFISEHAKLLHYATAVLGDPELAQDTVQETFLEAVRQAEEVKKHPNPQGWLMSTLKFKVKGCIRVRANYFRHFLSLDIELSNADSDSSFSVRNDPISMKYYLEIIRRLLPPDDFYLLNRIAFEDADYRQVAKELHISPASCRKRMERLRKKLRNILF